MQFMNDPQQAIETFNAFTPPPGRPMPPQMGPPSPTPQMGPPSDLAQYSEPAEALKPETDREGKRKKLADAMDIMGSFGEANTGMGALAQGMMGLAAGGETWGSIGSKIKGLFGRGG